MLKKIDGYKSFIVSVAGIFGGITLALHGVLKIWNGEEGFQEVKEGFEIMGLAAGGGALAHKWEKILRAVRDNGSKKVEPK